MTDVITLRVEHRSCSIRRRLERISRGSALVGCLVVACFFEPAQGWQTDFSSRNTPSHVAEIASDAAGDVIAAGGDRNKFFVAKYDGGSGEILWKRNVDSCCRAGGLAVDGAGNVLTAGVTHSGSTGNYLFTVVKLAPTDGAVLWRYDTMGASSQSAQANDLVLYAGGDVVAVGFRKSSNAGDDAHVVKLAAMTGALVWSTDLGGTAGGSDTARGVALDTSGNVLLGGYMAQTGSGADALVAKLDGTDGTELWRTTIDGSANDDDDIRAIAVDSANDVIAAGVLKNLGSRDLFVVKLEGDTGAELWRREIDAGVEDLIRDIDVDSANDIALVGDVGTTPNTDFVVAKIAGATGADLWRHDLNGTSWSDDRGAEVAFTATGDVLAVGEMGNIDTAVDLVAVRFAGATGAETWRARLSGRGGADSYDVGLNGSTLAHAIAADADGNVLLGGTLINSLRPDYDFAVAKVDGLSGADLLAGKKLLLADTGTYRKLKMQATGGVGIAPAGPSDPRTTGAVLEIYNPSSGETASVSLPADGWSAVENQYGVKAFKFIGDSTAPNPCKALIKPNRYVKVACKGPEIAFSLDETSQGTLALQMTTGSGSEVRRYCLSFGGTVVADTLGLFAAKDAPGPVACPFP